VRIERNDDGSNTLWVRQSSLGDAQLCPERVRNDILKLVPRRSNDAAAIGTSLHSVIETDIITPFDTLADAMDWGQQALSMIDLEEGIIWNNPEADARDWINRFTDVWWRLQYRDDLIDRYERALVEVEWEFDVPFFSTHTLDTFWDVRLEGTADILDHETGEIVDHKTSSSPYKLWEKQRWAVQPSVYTKAASIVYPDEQPWGFRYQVFVKRNNIGPEYHRVARDARHWAWLEDQIISFLPLLEQPDRPWPKTDDHALCSETWCSTFAAGRCKGAHTDLIRAW
jgi:hypothetical protein